MTRQDFGRTLAMWTVVFCLTGSSLGKVSFGTKPRHYAEVNTSFYNSSFLNWGGDNLVDRMGLTDLEAADARAKRLAELGITGVMYNGRHFRLSYPEEWEQIAEYAKIVADACHRYGIKVIEHHEFTIFSYSSYPMMLEKLDWLQRDVRTGEPWRWACPNNEDFIDYYTRYLQDYQRVANVDGFMLDEIAMASTFTCGCDYCRESYRKTFGQEMPNWGNELAFDNEDYRQWVRWRSEIPSRAEMKLMEGVREVTPRALRMTYCSDYSDSTTVRRGLDLTVDAALASSFVGWEVMISEALNGWRPFLRSLKMRNSYGNYYHIPVWSLNRQMMTKESVYFAWGLSQLGKHSIWFSERGIQSDEELAYFKRYNTWDNVMPHEHARCLTETGLLLSSQTRFTDWHREFMWHEMSGWADMMLEGSYQFDTLLDGDLELPGRLGKYRVLLLLGQSSLSEGQCEHLAKWVADGGTAIVTKHSSKYDEYGNDLGDFRLREAMGVSWDKNVSGGVSVRGAAGNRPMVFTAGKGFSGVKVIGQASKVLAVGTDGQGMEWPAVVETGYGKGRFIYVAADLGSQNYEWEGRNQSRMRTKESPQQKEAIWSLVDYAYGSAPVLTLDFPDGVTGVGYQQHGGDKNGMIYIHVLNVSGKTATTGYQFHYDVPEDIVLPLVDGELVVTLSGVECDGEAVVTTPMRPGQLVYAGKKLADGRVEYRIPAAALDAYLQIQIDAEEIISQRPCAVPLAEGVAVK